MAFWIFLVGGKGTRLGSLAADTPKPLLPVGGRPFLDYLLDRAVCLGADEILLLAGHLAGKVVASYHARPWNGVPVRCHVEAEPMGTAGALRQASAQLPARWVLMNGDTLFDVDPARLDQSGEEWMVSMALRRLDDTARSGTVSLKDGRVDEFHERGTGGPGLVNAGVYVMRRETVALLLEFYDFAIEVATEAPFATDEADRLIALARNQARHTPEEALSDVEALLARMKALPAEAGLELCRFVDRHRALFDVADAALPRSEPVPRGRRKAAIQ
ncbi:sugar phosphate nucleotidyltransferase [Shumkonia mesophila]|uniref:sugar phosphate nucleotidyltransferase n=1 Tax=Shumkonia mesophila TaxID=2838854 RepID=UPI0029350E5E|nr:sugar phosphate nucleotidyltransferase [Shumkonia mesophila]